MNEPGEEGTQLVLPTVHLVDKATRTQGPEDVEFVVSDWFGQHPRIPSARARDN